MKKQLIASLLLLTIGSTSLLAQEPEVVVEPVVAEFSDQELDQMLAPIALYPDTVLAHVLIAATYPLEVVQAARWTERNPDLEGDQAIEAVEDEDWDPSIKALVAFPDLLQRMSEDLDWTQKLGDAFLDDEERITARIQVLRQHAYEEGNLDKMEHVKVVKEEDAIILEPVVQEVVYVPYYDTRYVYGPWWWDLYPPVFWHHPHYLHDHYYTSFYWGPRVYLSSGFFFSGFLWHDHHIVVVDRHYHHTYHYSSSRQVVRHRDSRRWHHNPQHRRGVDYRNPRTRDYFENRTVRATSQDVRANRVNRVSTDREVEDVNSRSVVSTRKERPDASSVRDRLNRSTDDTRATRTNRDSRQNIPSERVERTNRDSREGRQSIKSEDYQRGNIKLQERDSRSQANDTPPQRSRESTSTQKRDYRREESSQSDERSSRQYNQSRDSSSRDSSARSSSRKQSADRSSSGRDSSRSSRSARERR